MKMVQATSAPRFHRHKSMMPSVLTQANPGTEIDNIFWFVDGRKIEPVLEKQTKCEVSYPLMFVVEIVVGHGI